MIKDLFYAGLEFIAIMSFITMLFILAIGLRL